MKTAEVWKGLEGLKLSDRDRKDIADVALGVHTQESADYLASYLKDHDETPENWTRYVHHIARYTAAARINGLLDLVKKASKHGRRLQAGLAKAIHQGLQERGMAPISALHAMAVEQARALLDSGDGGAIDMGIDLAGALKLPEVQPALRDLAMRDAAAIARRTAALKALASIDPAGNEPMLTNVLRDASAPLGIREAAAGVLAAGGRPASRSALIDAMPVAPGRLQSAIAAGLARRREGAEALLDAIAAGKASARLLQEQPVALALKQGNPPRLEERLKTLLAGLPPADRALAALLDRRRAEYRKSAASHRPDEGAAVFEKNCAACHQLGGKGGRVGPQLDGIGSRGIDRLFEDILDPNRNVDQAFRSTVLATENGQVVSGLLLREEGEVLILADAQGKEVRIPKETVVERKTSALSPMPANFADQVSREDFDRLLNYLLSRREPSDRPPGTK